MNNSYISGSPFRPQMNNSPTNGANNFVNLGNSFAPGSPFVPQANSSPANGANFVPNIYIAGSPFMPQMNSSPSNCGNNFRGFAPPFRSPSPHASPGNYDFRNDRSHLQYHNSPQLHSPRFNKISPYHSQRYSGSSSQSTVSFGNNDKRKINRNRLFEGSYNSSSQQSEISDESYVSAYSSPNNGRNKGRHSFRSSASDDSNPGHNTDIRRYIHPSMLEDPWKELMGKLEEKEIQPQKDNLGAASSSA